MPATVIGYHDRTPATVVEVRMFASGPRKGQVREVVARFDGWSVISGDERSGTAVYAYEPNPKGATVPFVLSLRGRNAGRWLQKGSGGTGWALALGYRERFCNPLFTSPASRSTMA